MSHLELCIYRLHRAEMCLQEHADSKGQDQPVHPLTESLDTVECSSGEQMPKYLC